MLFGSMTAALASPEDMMFSGNDYLRAKDSIVTFKGDFWRTGTQESDILLPLRDKWSKQIGQSYTQPVSSGDSIYTLADNNIIQINTTTETVKKIKIQDSLTPSLSGVTVIKNGEGWFNTDKVDRLVFGTQEGKLYCIKASDDVFDNSLIDWVFDTKNGKDIITNPAFLFDSVTKVPYITFGSADTYFYVLDSKGNKVYSSKENGKIVSSPLIFNSSNDPVYAVVLYEVDASTPYIVSGAMIGGNFIDNVIKLRIFDIKHSKNLLRLRVYEPENILLAYLLLIFKHANKTDGNICRIN